MNPNIYAGVLLAVTAVNFGVNSYLTKHKETPLGFQLSLLSCVVLCDAVVFFVFVPIAGERLIAGRTVAVVMLAVLVSAAVVAVSRQVSKSSQSDDDVRIAGR